ncbi:MAG: 1-phosphofructokinase family hexose kinase [Bacteroidota bacterium]
MPAIITVTFNPALDKSLSVSELTPDKKIKCPLPVCEPGGGGLNVARAIKKLGGDAVAIYLAGGEAGSIITKLLTDEGIKTVVVNTIQSTRENLIVTDLATSSQYLLDMPGANVTEEEWKACLEVIDTTQDVKYIIASGSLPSGVPIDIYARIALLAKKKGARLIVDTAGEPLKLAVQAGVFLIKPNIRELAALTGESELDLRSAPKAARQIISNGHCDAVVVSMGPDGALLVTEDVVMDIIPPALTVKSTVGAGDSMVAGIVMHLMENNDLIEAVKYGVACGSAATVHYGTELCEKADVNNIYEAIQTNDLNSLPEMSA